MQKITLTLLLFLSFNFGFSQNTNNYVSDYKLINLEEDLSFFEKIIFEGGIHNTFFSNENVCFWSGFQIHNPNANLHDTSPEKAYLNYKNDKFYYTLDGDTAYTFEKIKFEKIESGKTTFMGFDVTKYKSMDGNIEILIAKELPWYVQPCVFTDKIFDGAIVKLINHKTKRGLVLTDYKQLSKVPDEYKDIIKKIKNHPATKTETMVNPLLATEEEKTE